MQQNTLQVMRGTQRFGITQLIADRYDHRSVPTPSRVVAMVVLFWLTLATEPTAASSILWLFASVSLLSLTIVVCALSPRKDWPILSGLLFTVAIATALTRGFTPMHAVSFAAVRMVVAWLLVGGLRAVAGRSLLQR